MILADTSAWVEYDRETGSTVDLRFTSLLESEERLAVTEPVITEVLAGARTDARAAELGRLLASVELLPLESVADFQSAAWIYRQCRRSGITPRGLIDCMIAAVALRTGADLLAYDVDLARIAAIIGVRLDPASLAA